MDNKDRKKKDKERAKIAKNNCLDCCDRNIGKALACTDTNCFHWADHTFWINYNWKDANVI